MEIDDAKAEEIRQIVETGTGDREYWRSCTPDERLYALELMRRKTWGYDDSARLDRSFFEIVNLKKYLKSPEAQPSNSPIDSE